MPTGRRFLGLSDLIGLDHKSIALSMRGQATIGAAKGSPLALLSLSTWRIRRNDIAVIVAGEFTAPPIDVPIAST